MSEPKIVEVDEAELLRLRRNQETLGAMLKHPTARKRLAAAVKEILPDDTLAKEADAVDPVQARFDELAKQNADLAKQIVDDKAERERDGKLGELRANQDRGFETLRQAKWTQDGIDKVKKVMEEKGILDVEIAAKWVESQMPPQNPVTPGGTGGFGFFDSPAAESDDFVKKLIESKGENEALISRQAHDAIADIRGVSRR